MALLCPSVTCIDAPAFEQKDRDRVIELRDRVEPGVQIFTLHATDPDSPAEAAGQLEYKIVEGPPLTSRDPYGPFIGIEQHTGALVLERSLRRSDLTNGDGKPHRLKIEARDRSPKPKSATVTVYVRVYESALPPFSSQIDPVPLLDPKWSQSSHRAGAGADGSGQQGRGHPSRSDAEGFDGDQETGGTGMMTGLLTAALLLLMCLMVVLAIVLLTLFLRARRAATTTNKPNNDAECTILYSYMQFVSEDL